MMKWKLTLRYLFSLLIVVAIVIVVNSVILLWLLFSSASTGLEELSGQSGQDFTRSFQQYLELEESGPIVNQEGIDALTELNRFVQVLDENGRVVYEANAPDYVLDHYTPIELVHMYRNMDEHLTTYFIAPFEQYSYLIGIPNSSERRHMFMLDSNEAPSILFKGFLIMIIVDLFIAAIIGLFFSSILTRPIAKMIDRISELRKFDFHPKKVKSAGIYKPVFNNLNDVSSTLAKHEEERNKLEKMRNEWIRNVSHDIKTPLASIRGYAELLKDDSVTTAERQEYADIIERKSLYMKDLLDDFNLTMRLRNEEMPLQLQQTDMNGFVRDLVIGVLNDPEYTERTIDFNPSNESAYWQIDQHLMRRALLNFIYNTFVHNDEHVQLTITVNPNEIIIADNGKGISKEDLPHIFNRYYRGTDTDNIQGTGLGTAIAHDIVTAHKGTISIESDIGQGTTIYIKW